MAQISRYGTFLKRWHEKWSVVLKFRDQSAFSQCDVCQELKSQPLGDVSLGSRQYAWRYILGSSVIVIFKMSLHLELFSFVINPDSRTKRYKWTFVLVLWNCTVATWWTSTQTGARSGVFVTYQDQCYQELAFVWRMGLIRHKVQITCNLCWVAGWFCKRGPCGLVLNYAGKPAGKVHDSTKPYIENLLPVKQNAKTQNEGPWHLDVWVCSENSSGWRKHFPWKFNGFWAYQLGAGRYHRSMQRERCLCAWHHGNSWRQYCQRTQEQSLP